MQGNSQKEELINGQKEVLLAKKKKILIVVGRMGHGKSSFCKMIVDDSERDKVKVKAAYKSVTLDCSFYISSRFTQIFGQEIFVTDTPGIDSRASVSKIVEDIDSLVIEHNADIVGIAYVIDIRQREQSQEDENFIFTFLEFLRIKHCDKNNLVFCILSKFDVHQLEDDEENDEIIDEIGEMFHQHDYEAVWNHRIKWMSEPSGMKTKIAFEKNINGNLKEMYENQFTQLKTIFSKAVSNNHCLAAEKYLSDRQQFEKKFIEAIIKDYNKFQHQSQTEEFEIIVDISAATFKDHVSKALISLQLGTVTTVASIMGGAVVAEGVVATAVGGAVATAALPITLIVAGGVASIALVSYGLAKFWSKYKYSIQSSISEEEKQKIVSNIIKQKLKICLITAATQQIKMDDRQFIIQDLPYITSIKCFDEGKKELKIKKDIQDNKHISKSSLKVGKNTVKFTYKLPTVSYAEKYLRQITKQFYEQKV